VRAWAGVTAVALGLLLWSPVTASAAALATGPVTSVKVTKATPSSVSLSWVNPAGSSFAGAVVRAAKGTTPPKSPASGKLIGTIKKPGRAITAKGLTASATYSFTVFAYGKGRHYAKGASVTAKTRSKPTAAAITSADAAAFSVRKTGTFTVKAAGYPAPTITESGALPSGVSFSSSTRVLSGTPAAGTGGKYPVTFTASNRVGPPAVQHFTLSVDQRPAITSGSAATFSIGVSATFAVRTTGYPVPSVTESGSLPAGVSFDSETGILSGKPAVGTTGTYPLTFTANSVAQDFTLVVSATPACTDTWTGADSSDWDDPGNWSSSQVPGASDWACIPAGGSNEPVMVSNGEYESVSGLTDSGSLEVDGSLTLWGTQQSAVAGTLTVNDSLTLADAIAVTGTLDLESGRVSGPGTVTIDSGATWTVEGGQIDDVEVVNDGTTTVEAADTLVIQPGTTLLNDAGLTMLANAAIEGEEYACPVSPELVNGGTLTVAATTTGTDSLGLNNFAYNCLTVANSGAIDLSSGTLDLASGTLDLDSGTSFSGPGTLESQSALSVNTALSIASLELEQDGNLTGSSPLTVTGSLDSDGSTFQGPGTVTVGSGATWSVEATTINGGTVVNDGSAELGANDDLTIEPGSQLSNTASLTMDADSAITGNGDDCPVSPEFVNSGTLTVAATSTGTDSLGENTFSYLCLTVANSGAVDLASGTLDVAAGTLDLDSGTSFSGSGTLESQGTLSVNTTLSIPDLADDGTLTGSSPLTVTASLDTDGGSFDGPATVTVGSGAAWSIESTAIESGTVVNDGTAELGANDALTIQPGAELSNTASLTMDADSAIDGNQNACPAPAELANSGTLTVAATKTGTDSFSDCLTVDDSGAVDLASGTLDLSRGLLDLDSGNGFSGSGTLEAQGTIAVGVASSVPVLELDGGTVQGTGGLTVTSALTEGNGTFAGPGPVTIGSGASWEISSTSVTGGEIVSEGLATLDKGSSLSIYEGASVVNDSTMTFDADSSVLGACSDQNATADLDNSGTLDIAAGTGNTATLSGDEFDHCLAVDNTAALELSTGGLDVQAGSVLQLGSGTSVSGPGALEDPSGTIVAEESLTIPVLDLTGGTLEIPPTVTATVSSLPTPSGTIQLDGTASFGQLAAGGTAAVGSLDVFFSASSYSPACGATVTVATAGKISGTLSSISGGTLPSGASWNAQSTATAAQAVVTC
jgi:large repetitive protein